MEEGNRPRHGCSCAYAVIVEARPLPKGASYVVPWTFAGAFDSGDKFRRPEGGQGTQDTGHA